MKIGRILTMTILGFGLLLGSSPWSRQAKATETLVYATFFADVYSGSKNDIWFMDELTKRSKGELKFEKYWANSLVAATDLMPSLSGGAADIVNGAPVAYNGRDYPLAGVMMPFLTTQLDSALLAWRDLYRNNKDFRNEFEKQGVKVLYPFAWAENTIWSRKPVSKISEFKGLKVRAPPPIAKAILLLGGTPVAIAWTEGIEALQRGVVDAFSSAPFDSAVHGHMQDVAKYGNDLGGSGIFGVNVVAMSLRRYNSLSPELRKIIDDVSEGMPAKGVKFNDVSIDSAVDKLCAMKSALTTTPFDKADRERVQKEVAAKLQEDWIKRVNATTKVDAKALLKEFVGYIRKYEPQSTYVPGFERYEKKCGSKSK
ncbi:MAG: TRAP transporter substrate-binding protein DctP [Hyphomicrobiaceae bacterium]